MQKVKDILARKGSNVYVINKQSTVFDALLEMRSKNVSAVLVIENDAIRGIFTERDYARKVALEGKTSKDTFIYEVMSTDIITITSDYSVEQCMEIMTNQHVRHLPVVEEGKVGGMISIGDAVKTIIEAQKETIKQLENYINS